MRCNIFTSLHHLIYYTMSYLLICYELIIIIHHTTLYCIAYCDFIFMKYDNIVCYLIWGWGAYNVVLWLVTYINICICVHWRLCTCIYDIPISVYCYILSKECIRPTCILYWINCVFDMNMTYMYIIRAK